MEQGAENKNDGYLKKLKIKMDRYAHLVYKIAKNIPKEEIFGLTAQLKRASLSVPLNYIEGYARALGGGDKVYKNFLKISYGSLKESKYILVFSLEEGFIARADYEEAAALADEIGAMLYKIML